MSVKQEQPFEKDIELIGENGSTLQNSFHEHDLATSTDAIENSPQLVPETAVQAVEPAAWVPPDGGYGWVCVVACFFINAHTWGVNSSYGVFLAHYLQNNTYPGATRIHFAFIGGLSIGIALLISPLATYGIRKLGTRTVLLSGVFFQTVSLLAASFTKQIWQLFLSQGVCFGLGMGMLFVGSVGIIPQWFTSKRSLANGISASGSGLGGLIYSLAIGSLIPKVGLEWSFRVLCFVTLGVNLTCALLLRDRNKHLGSSLAAFDVRLLRLKQYWALLGFGVFSMFGYVVLLFSLSNYSNYIGLTPQQGSVVSALLNLGQAIGRPPVGYFSDRIGRINMAGGMTFLSGLFCLAVWINAKSYGVLIFYALIGGTTAGTFWATVAPVTAEVVGLKEVPAALSIIWVVIAIPALVSEPIGLEIVADEGGYLGAQLYCGIMYVAASFCMFYLRGWKIGEIEQSGEMDLNHASNNCSQVDDKTEIQGQTGQRRSSPFVARLFRLAKV